MNLTKVFRFFLAILFFVLSVKPAFAGNRCNTCYVKKAPIVVQQVQPQVTQNITQYTYQFVTNGVPYAASGATIYQAQFLEKRLLADQLSRNTQQSLLLAEKFGQVQAEVGYGIISEDNLLASQSLESQDIREFRGMFRDFLVYKTQMRQVRGGNGVNGAGVNGANQPPIPVSPIQELVNNRCLKCHQGQKAKKGLDLSDIATIEFAVWKEKIMPKVRSGEMPPQAQGEEPLKDSEKLLFCDAWTELLEAAISQQ